MVAGGSLYAQSTGRQYQAVGGTVTVPVSVKTHSAGDATYCGRVFYAE